MKIITLKVGAIETNCYIVNIGNSLYVIDPGGDYDLIIRHIEEIDLPVKTILLTHAHIDHIGAVKELCLKYKVPVFLNKNDVSLYLSPANALPPFIPPIKGLPETVDSFDDRSFEILHTPGHTQGSVCFYFNKNNVLFCGDTLFCGGIGRTDLPGGSYSDIIKSIEKKILTLPGDTTVYSGHGPSTTIQKEKDTNPFLM